jgi:DNA modification methylase
MEIIKKRVADIKPYEKNAKKHPRKQIEQVAESIKEFGWGQPIVVDKQGVIIVGHARYEASIMLGLSEIPCVVFDLSEEKARAYRLADNKLNESEWNMDLVLAELRELSAPLVDLTGFDKDLLLTQEDKDDEIPEKPENPKSKTGDIYVLGKHRIICGDSTKEEVYNQLFDGKRAKMVFTSPPYNMGAKMYKTYQDDLDSEEYVKFNLTVAELCTRHLFGFLFWNISYNKNSRSEFLEIASRIAKESGVRFIELIVWNKKHAMPITSNKGLTRTYEDIFMYGTEDEVAVELEVYALGENNRNYTFNKTTNRGISNYWEVNVNKVQLDNHKACFPVGLPTKAITLTTKEGDIVMDPFMGSGSTLIACEKSGRVGYGIEMDPAYVDVIIQRWVDYTGNTEVVKNGEKEVWEKKK